MKTGDALFSILSKLKDKGSLSNNESEDIGDIADSEVAFYLNNERESHYKKIIWGEINKEYLQEQAAKELGRAIDGPVAQKSKKRPRQREAAKNNPARADTVSEATHEMQTKKRLSSKIDFDALDRLFSDSPASGSNEKIGTSSREENGSTGKSQCRDQLGEDLEDKSPDVVLDEDDDGEDEDPTESYENEYFGFEDEEEYGYNHDGYGHDDGY